VASTATAILALSVPVDVTATHLVAVTARHVHLDIALLGKLFLCRMWHKQYGVMLLTNCTYETSCSSCLGGTYSSLVGSTACESCSPEYITSAPRRPSPNNCVACARGKSSEPWSEMPGFICTKCAPRTYSSSIGRTECESCSASYSSTIEGSFSQNDCRACAIGTYAFSNLGLGCSPCLEGSYSSSIGSISKSFILKARIAF